MWEWIHNYTVESIKHFRGSLIKKFYFITYNHNFLNNEEYSELAIYSFANIQHKMSNFGAFLHQNAKSRYFNLKEFSKQKFADSFIYRYYF